MEWKYTTLYLTAPISEHHLEQMGKQGWELTGCIPQDKLVTRYIYYFKMPKEAPVHGGPR